MLHFKFSHPILHAIPSYFPRLEEIGIAANKEFSIEKSLEKMQQEWAKIEFTLIPYRETREVSIFSFLDWKRSGFARPKSTA